MRAAIYTRLSRSTEASTSIERQRETCRALILARGWEVVQVEEDNDVSASKARLDRPGLDAIRANYPALDAVVYWKTDRLARSLLDYASLLEEADRADVALVSATEPLDLSSPMGRAMAQVVAIFAELEARTIGARMESTIDHLKRTGRAPGGRLPYGFQRVANPDGPGFVVALDPAEAPVVREAAERVASGEPMLAVARDLTARRVPTATGGDRWNPATLKTLLRNPALIGRTVHRGEVLRADDGLPLAHRPPILTMAEWGALQATLDARAQPQNRRVTGGTMLRGLAVCGLCGRVLSGSTRKAPSGHRLAYYVCGASGQGRACKGVSVSRPRLDAFVAEEFLKAYGRVPVVRVTPSAPSATDEEVAAVREALGDLERDRYERGLFRDTDGTARFAEIHARLSARLAALDAEHLPSLPSIQRTGQTYAEAWAGAGDDAARRALLAECLDSVTVSPTKAREWAPERVSIAWK